MKIYLSPSTQEHNIGCGNYGTEEQRMNEITDVLQMRLQEHGVTVYRNKPDMTLAQITEASDRFEVDYHIAPHSNASGKTPGTARGCTVLICAKGGKAEELANNVYTELSAITPTTDRGVVVDPKLWETKEPKAPAIIIEVDFHDNYEGAAWIIHHTNQIAEAILLGILKQVNIKYIPRSNSFGCSKWAEAAWTWGVLNNIIDGTFPHKECTREEVIVMLHRFNKLK